MITSIQGILSAATPLAAVIEINGLGYEVNIPVTTAEKLPKIGETVKLHTLVIYREDSQTLYGFSTPHERDFFRMIVEKVSGIGPKLAITIMSKLSLPMLESAIRNSDAATLSKCPGIGKKTAERLIIELRGKLDTTSPASALSASETPATSPTNDMRYQDAVLALTTLGYKTADADKAVRKAASVLGSEASTEELIKKAFSL